MNLLPSLRTVLVATLASTATLLPSAAPPASATPGNWTKVGSYQPPITRYGSAMARDQTGRVILFGGITTGSLGIEADTWTFDGTRWVELQPPSSPPARVFAMAAYDAARGEIVLFGGNGEAGQLGDTWTWDGTSWTERTPVASPPPRSAGGMAYDPATEKVVLFGGRLNNVPFGDTWTWDGSTWTPEAAAVSPPARYEFGFADGGATSKPVLFGGSNDPTNEVQFDDTWTWDGPGGLWTAEALTGTRPGDRRGTTLTYDPASDQALLLGGTHRPEGNPLGQENYGDTWAWDGSTWTELAPSPQTRFYTHMAYDAVDERVTLFGGIACTPIPNFGCLGSYSNDTWVWSGSEWVQVDITAPILMQNSMLAREPGPATVMFGGQYRYGHYSQETWRWTGVEWQRLYPASAPLPRGMSAMTYDAARNETILFGGQVDNLGLPGPRQVYQGSDTWIWDGTDWTELEPATSPSKRAHASIAYDAGRAEVVLFGGQTGGAAMDDTWTWNGTDWTEQFPTTSPPPRFAAQMTYDPVRGRVVLFGGSQSSSQGWYDDTWEWDGVDWAPVTTASRPAARAYGGMAFDPVTERAILFGGCSGCFGNPTYDETWSFDGSAWTRLFPTNAPDRRTSFSVVSGDWRGPMLLFSGRRAVLTPAGGSQNFPEGTGFTNDVWEFSSGSLVGVLVSLVSARAEAEQLVLTWRVTGGAALDAMVYRRTALGDWERIGAPSRVGQDLLRFEDSHVAAGERYAYRLGYWDEGVEGFAPEVWVDVPAAVAFALGGARSNPSASSDLLVSLSLPSNDRAVLNLYDVRGRRVRAREVGSLGPGHHVVPLTGERPLAAGAYWLRLTQGQRSLTIKTIVF